MMRIRSIAILTALASALSASLLPPVAGAAPDPQPFLGTWLPEKAGGALAEVVIAPSGRALTLHAFGSCQPSACDIGTASFSIDDTGDGRGEAIYDLSFKQMKVYVISQRSSAGEQELIIEQYSKFTDSSGRKPYTTTQTFHRARHLHLFR